MGMFNDNICIHQNSEGDCTLNFSGVLQENYELKQKLAEMEKVVFAYEIDDIYYIASDIGEKFPYPVAFMDVKAICKHPNGMKFEGACATIRVEIRKNVAFEVERAIKDVENKYDIYINRKFITKQGEKR